MIQTAMHLGAATVMRTCRVSVPIARSEDHTVAINMDFIEGRLVVKLGFSFFVTVGA